MDLGSSISGFVVGSWGSCRAYFNEIILRGNLNFFIIGKEITVKISKAAEEILLSGGRGGEEVISTSLSDMPYSGHAISDDALFRHL